MKAIRSAEGGVAVVDVDEPPGTGELLTMKSTSICASDLSYIKFGSRSILGHELAGIREDGTAVVVEAIYGCMACDDCLRGAYNLCPAHRQRALGIGADGGMAEQFRWPSASLVAVPDGLDVRDASPGGTVVVLGVHFGTVELDWMPLFHREARLIPSLGYCRHESGREMDDAAAMLAENPEIAHALVTHRFPIEDAAEAFRVAGDRAAGAIRVVIEPS